MRRLALNGIWDNIFEGLECWAKVFGLESLSNREPQQENKITKVKFEYDILKIIYCYKVIAKALWRYRSGKYSVPIPL